MNINQTLRDCKITFLEYERNHYVTNNLHISHYNILNTFHFYNWYRSNILHTYSDCSKYFQNIRHCQGIIYINSCLGHQIIHKIPQYIDHIMINQSNQYIYYQSTSKIYRNDNLNGIEHSREVTNLLIFKYI